MPKFNKGDKVRYLKPYPSDWNGVVGTVVEIEGTLTKVTLDTDISYYKAGDDVKLYTSMLELVEAAATVWKVGDLVEFWDEGNDHWQGGKGKVTANPAVTYDRKGFVDVEILEEMPLNTLQKVGVVVAVPEKDLRDYLEPWERELLGWDEAPKGEPEEVDEEELTESKPEAVNHPPHYGGDTTYETWKVAEAWGLDKDAYLFNVLKYISRAGKKNDIQEDLEKAEAYLKRRIAHPLEV